MLKTGSRDFTGLAADLRQLACIMGLGVITAFTYNRIMVNVSQGTMRRLRDDLFRRMEALPIKYFDTHAHGDIMSVYTNDVDTLRQLLSQSIPQIINSLISMAATLVTMIILNPALTVISILTAVVMLMVTTNFSKLSGKYYVRQQIDLGAVDGFIEEMLLTARRWSRSSATSRRPWKISIRSMKSSETAPTRPTATPTC